jgi:hypothetical protein
MRSQAVFYHAKASRVKIVTKEVNEPTETAEEEEQSQPELQQWSQEVVEEEEEHEEEKEESVKRETGGDKGKASESS